MTRGLVCRERVRRAGAFERVLSILELFVISSIS